MDNNIKWVNEVKINRTIEALRKNNMESFFIIYVIIFIKL